MLFYLFPYYLPSVILIAAAVIPAVALLYYVYRADTVEKEPPLLLLRLVLLGILSTAAAKLLEYAGVFILNAVFRRESFLYLALLYFGVVGFAEEGSKYALLKRATWNSPHFNCRFGIRVAGLRIVGKHRLCPRQWLRYRADPRADRRPGARLLRGVHGLLVFPGALAGEPGRRRGGPLHARADGGAPRAAARGL